MPSATRNNSGRNSSRAAAGHHPPQENHDAVPADRARDSTVFGYEILTRSVQLVVPPNSDMLFSFAREAKLAWALEAIALEGALRRLRQVDFVDRKFLLNLEAEMFGESSSASTNGVVLRGKRALRLRAH
jgi:hypothetical protein